MVPTSALDACWFVTWSFPEVSQTFIHREMSEMERLGYRVNVLAAYRVRPGDPAMEAIADRALYLGSPATWVPAGLAWVARHPRRFADTLRWVLKLPHRTVGHRLRVTAMLLAAAAVADRLQAAGCRYVHAHFAAYHTEWAMCTARLLDVPYGATFHATGIWKDRNLLAEKVAGSELIMTCTAANAAHLREQAPAYADRVHLVHHGLDFERIPAPTPMPPPSPTHLLAIGRLVPKKGFADLIAAVAQLRAAGHAVEATILGEGPEREALEEACRTHGVADAVHLPGPVPNSAVWEALQQSHALVAPSVRGQDGNQDGIPNVVLEAMAAGRPAIGTRLSGLPEVIVEGERGWLAEPGDAASLAEAMARIVTDPDGAARMGANARAFVETHFDVRANVHHQLRLLDAAMEA